MHDMRQKDGFCWGKEQTDAFNQLKVVMCNALVLALPDFSQAFVLKKYASGSGLGVVLMQNKRSIAYLNKTLGEPCQLMIKKP